MRNVNDRLLISRWIAAAGTLSTLGNTSENMKPGLARQIEDHAWSIADGLVSRAEKMRAEDAEAARKEVEAAEAEAAKLCQLRVPEGFEGPCVNGPHPEGKPCVNAAGDKW